MSADQIYNLLVQLSIPSLGITAVAYAVRRWVA
jgi:hypothetical protein